MKFLDSRFIGMFDVPDPKEINARFVYNFFVTDETTNMSGLARFQGIVSEATQRDINNRALDAQLPRFVEINFTRTDAGFDNINDFSLQNTLSSYKNLVQTEESISTSQDAVLSYSDPDLKTRISKKANFLSKILRPDFDNSTGTEAKVETILEFTPDIDSQSLKEIISIDNKVGVISVNEVGDLAEDPIFSKAALSAYNLMADRRTLRTLLCGVYSKESPVKTGLYDLSLNDSLKYLPNASDDSSEKSDEPTLVTLNAEKVGAPSDKVKSVTVV